MAYTEAGKEATNKYRTKFDLIQIRIPQGGRKLIRDHAEEHGESTNAFIKRAIKETMARDNADTEAQE